MTQAGCLRHKKPISTPPSAKCFRRSRVEAIVLDPGLTEESDKFERLVVSAEAFGGRHRQPPT